MHFCSDASEHWGIDLQRERDLRFFLFNSAHLMAAHKSPSLCWLSQPLMLSQLTPGSIDFWKTSIHANSKQWYCLKSALSWTSWLVSPSCKLLIVGSLTRWRSGCVRLEETSIKRNTFHCKKNKLNRTEDSLPLNEERREEGHSGCEPHNCPLWPTALTKDGYLAACPVCRY